MKSNNSRKLSQLLTKKIAGMARGLSHYDKRVEFVKECLSRPRVATKSEEPHFFDKIRRLHLNINLKVAFLMYLQSYKITKTGINKDVVKLSDLNRTGEMMM